MYAFGFGSGLGAIGAEPASDPCAPCYSAKSEAYQGCQKLPAGSADRETCFRRADADLGNCLDTCTGRAGASSGSILVVGALAVAAVALLS
jgi:hypothetical protein